MFQRLLCQNIINMNKENATIPLEKLFGSKTRAKLLALFFENTEKSYYVREITRVIEEQINSVRRELTNLSALGLGEDRSGEVPAPGAHPPYCDEPHSWPRWFGPLDYWR